MLSIEIIWLLCLAKQCNMFILCNYMYILIVYYVYSIYDILYTYMWTSQVAQW